jgi:hypothetical protein
MNKILLAASLLVHLDAHCLDLLDESCCHVWPYVKWPSEAYPSFHERNRLALCSQPFPSGSCCRRP